MSKALQPLLRKLALLAACFTLSVSSIVKAEDCSRVSAYWYTNMVSLVENITECDAFAWQKCSQAAAIHYDLVAGSLAQRADSCGINPPDVPGWDYTEPQATDNGMCLTARGDLRETFDTRAMARMACAAAREGGDDQEWLNSQCEMYRSQMGNYHLKFKEVANHCELDHEQLVATLERW